MKISRLDVRVPMSSNCHAVDQAAVESFRAAPEADARRNAEEMNAIAAADTGNYFRSHHLCY
jgi:hypothetical protein